MSTLGSVKVGDYIAWTTIGDSVSVVRVDRVTPIQEITGARRWRGLVWARGYDCEWARPATDDDALKATALIKSLEAQEAPPAEGE